MDVASLSRVVVRTVDRLPDAVAAEHAAAVEKTLTGFSHDFDPGTVDRLGECVLAHLDPDGKEAAAATRARRRDLTLRMRPDGSGTLTGDLTAACCQKLLTVLDPLAKPRPPVTNPTAAGPDNAATTPSRTCATGSCAAAPCPTAAACPPPWWSR